MPVQKPGELRVLLETISEALAGNVIRELPTASVQWSTKFEELSPEGPWPDYIGCRFQCSDCAQRFELSVETYHGSGGRWSAVEEP